MHRLAINDRRFLFQSTIIFELQVMCCTGGSASASAHCKVAPRQQILRAPALEAAQISARHRPAHRRVQRSLGSLPGAPLHAFVGIKPGLMPPQTLKANTAGQRHVDLRLTSCGGCRRCHGQPGTVLMHHGRLSLVFLNHCNCLSCSSPSLSVHLKAAINVYSG